MPNLLNPTDTSSRMRCPHLGFAPVALLFTVGLLPIAGCNHSHNADVIATVNGHPIMQSELDKSYAAQLGDAQQQKPSQDQADSLRLNLLHVIIDDEIMEQRAAKMNLTATNEEVDAKLAELKARYPEDQFEQKLKATNQTVEDLKHGIRRGLTIDKLLNKEIKIGRAHV